MNERLQELARQAGFYANPDVEKFEKFAELIVVECVEIANKQFTAATGLDDRDCWTAAEMKKRFGVKE